MRGAGHISTTSSLQESQNRQLGCSPPHHTQLYLGSAVWQRLQSKCPTEQLYRVTAGREDIDAGISNPNSSFLWKQKSGKWDNKCSLLFYKRGAIVTITQGLVTLIFTSSRPKLSLHPCSHTMKIFYAVHTEVLLPLYINGCTEFKLRGQIAVLQRDQNRVTERNLKYINPMIINQNMRNSCLVIQITKLKMFRSKSQDILAGSFSLPFIHSKISAYPGMHLMEYQHRFWDLLAWIMAPIQWYNN